MKHLKIPKYSFFILVYLLAVTLHPVEAQDQTVGLFVKKAGVFDGYTLFAPMRFTTTYLIDIDGKLVHTWQCDFKPGLSAYLLPNGNLLRTAQINNPNFSAGGAGGRIQEFTWDGRLVWDFQYSSADFMQHHDVEKLPNGNVLIIAWERKTAGQVIAAGRNPALLRENELWPETIIEVEPVGLNGGNIVWEWHVWDHLIQDFDSTKSNYGIVADHPELFDLNFDSGKGTKKGIADWNHFNSIDYHPELDQILVSSLKFSEIYIIDHNTTTAEAAGHSGGRYGRGGDILYRWGNPVTYRAGDVTDQKFFRQHDASWIEPGLPGEGNIMVFNNGRNRPEGSYSSVDEIIPPTDSLGNYNIPPNSAFPPLDLHWRYSAPNPADFFSQNISGAQRLPNGNTLVCSGTKGRVFEVTSDNEIVWEYINPVIEKGPVNQGEPIAVGLNNDKYLNTVFRAYRYASDYPGLLSKDLSPGEPVEGYPTSISETEVASQPSGFSLMQNYPNPISLSNGNLVTSIRFRLPGQSMVTLTLYDLLGNELKTITQNFLQAGLHSFDLSMKNFSTGVYFYKIRAGQFAETKKMIIVE